MRRDFSANLDLESGMHETPEKDLEFWIFSGWFFSKVHGEEQ